MQARVLAVEELVELSQEDLLRMQENLALAMSKRMEMEMKVRRSGILSCVPGRLCLEDKLSLMVEG